MLSWPASISLALLITSRSHCPGPSIHAVSALCSGCLTTSSSSFSRARAAGVANLVDLPMRAAKCERADFGTYSAPELRELATLYPFQSKAELSVEEGGRLSCGFDRPDEYCSWTASGSQDGSGFQKARFETFFDFEKFDCTSDRSFSFDEYFLLAGGEDAPMQTVALEVEIPYEYFLLAGGEDAPMQTVALEVEIPCQLGTSTVQFDYWTNSDMPILKACTVSGPGAEPNCAELSLEPNPLMFEVPQNIVPFRIRIEVANLAADDIVLLDNVLFKGQICEVNIVPFRIRIEVANLAADDIVLLDNVLFKGQICEVLEQSLSLPSIPTTIPSFVSSSASFDPTPTLIPLEDVTSRLQQPIVDGSAVPQEVDSDAVIENEFELTDSAAVNEICDSLQCNFNANDACFYNVAGLGSTGEWRVGNGHLGNRLTGVRMNPNDPSNGGFLYVGREHFDQSADVFVLESVKFALGEPVMLVFDVFQRSFGPRLKVCLNTFDNCPYANPPIKASEWWFRDQELLLDKSTQKVYFVADRVSANLYLALDNIRLRNAADNRPLCSR
uniref:MAM domain-containing protein n=1 Tax=Steinernema glaseri TaxID=37863 RepID=A0A1I8AG04_9BILA